MPNQRYQYNPMDDPFHQIRLVNILPRRGRKGLRLELDVVSIKEVNGQYDAVSYMWGSPSPERHVIINGKTLLLRDNIWRCLKHLRDYDLTRSRLWIDTICINQCDDHEKSQQVAKMGDIFKYASRVLIWLGSTSLQTYMHDPGSDTLRDSIETLPAKDWDAWFAVLGHSDTRSLSLENQIMSIVYNSYWQRLWIIQEIALSRKACIILGKALLGNDFISAIYQAARENSKPGYRSWIARQTIAKTMDPNIIDSGTALLDHHPMLRAGHTAEMGHKSHTKETFGQLIQAQYWHRCVNPRDYVYGLVGLVDLHPRFKIDYTLFKEEVAVQALQHLQKEAMQASSYQMGFDLGAAAALLKALNVATSGYSRVERTLPIARAEALRRTTYHIKLAPMSILTANGGTGNAETKAYEEVCQLNVSGSLMKKMYELKSEQPFTMKLLSGRIKGFSYVKTSFSDEDAQSSNRLETEPGVLLLCWLHMMPAIILRRSSNEDNTIKIAHFVLPDLTRRDHESSPWLEKRLPKIVRDALQREIGICAKDWNDLCQDVYCSSFLQFSTLEVISLCSLLAPVAPDGGQFWDNS